jgi:hypothetical protein
MRIKSVKITIMVFAMLITAGVASAYASAATVRSPAAVTAAVFGSSNPQAAFQSLNVADQKVFTAAFSNQTSVLAVSRGGAYTPTAVERAAMITGDAPAGLSTPGGVSKAAVASGCWYRYWQNNYYDLGIHDGSSWMQLNWCGSGGRITSWSQSNYGCTGYDGASCSVGSSENQNVGWEDRSVRNFTAHLGWFSNGLCQEIRGGATGQYSEFTKSGSPCTLN